MRPMTSATATDESQEQIRNKLGSKNTNMDMILNIL